MKYITGKSKPLTGKTRVASDKSISHRALMLGLINLGKTSIKGLLEADDVKRTMKNCRMLGAEISHNGDLTTIARSRVIEPNNILDFGNSGTGARLMAGVIAGYPLFSVITGDASLRKRPMRRIADPLCEMGATIHLRSNRFLPAAIIGGKLKGINHKNSIGSAQVKSAIMFASLNANGTTVIEDPKRSRDHTERLLIQSEANITVTGNKIALEKSVINRNLEIMVPADFSSAAFIIAYALLRKGSEITLKEVGINPTRTGMLKILELFGAKIEVTKRYEFGLEPVADLYVSYQRENMRGTEIPESLVISAIDEIPIIAAIAASIEGKTTIRGAKELRYKESDRIRLIVQNLASLGVKCTEYDDGFEIEGTDKIQNATILTDFDHRIAMSFIILGSVFENRLEIEDIESIQTSYPNFFENLML